MKALSPSYYERRKREGETGSQFEADFIGQIDTRDPQYLAAWKKAYKEELEDYQKGKWPIGNPPPTNGHLRFKNALELARNFQPYRPPYNPSNPDKPFARDIRLGVIQLFEKYVFKRKTTPEERQRFKFFTGADKYNEGEEGAQSNSPIDRHGIDAWLEYTDETGQIYLATFDLTRKSREGKGERKSSRDILITEQELGDPHLEIDKYETAIEKLAQEAIQKMVHRTLLEKKIVM